jgi:hypothetical protein
LSPIAEVEPLIVAYCFQPAHIGRPIDKTQLMLLASSLISDTKYLRELISFKEARDILVDMDSLLGKRWYLSFMRRNKDKVRKGQLKIRDVKRHTWCTYNTFTDMYNCVYSTMHEIGICKYLPEPVMLDMKGNTIREAEKMFGRPINSILEHPEMMIFVDKTGSNTCQVSNGHVGGQLFILPKDGVVKGTLGSVTDIHFTVLPFNAGTGEADTCAIILKSEKAIEDIPLSWRYGTDITKSITSRDVLVDDIVDIFIQNSGTGTSMAGGPTCSFQGKEIPCFVCTLPEASSSSQLLADMLSFLDSFNVFDCTNGKNHSYSSMVITVEWTYHFSITFMILIMNGLAVLESHMPLIFGKWQTRHSSKDPSSWSSQN